MDARWERRERKRRNARKMRVHGAGIREVWRQIVERAQKKRGPLRQEDKPSG
jgi:hypothetical protein